MCQLLNRVPGVRVLSEPDFDVQVQELALAKKLTVAEANRFIRNGFKFLIRPVSLKKQNHQFVTKKLILKFLKGECHREVLFTPGVQILPLGFTVHSRAEERIP